MDGSKESDDSMKLIDFMDEYAKQCSIKKIKVVDYLKKSLQESVDNAIIPNSLKLKGTINELRESRIDDNSATAIMTALCSYCFLTSIDISFNEIGDKGASSIADFIKTDNRVKQFILKSNSIGPHGGALIGKALMMNETIEGFDISYNPIGNEGGMEFAAALQVNTAINKLLLSHCSLGTDALIALSTVLSSSRTVKTICLGNNENNFSRLTQSGCNDVMLHVCNMIKANRGILVLGLGKSGISDFQCVQHLAPALLANRKLARVDLSCNKITRDGGVAICQALYKQSFLTHLNLSCCSIQDEGAEAVSVMLTYNHTLQTLFLDYNRIASKGLRNIANALAIRNRSLRCLTLWGNMWDEHACKEFSPLVGGPRNVDKESLGKKREEPGHGSPLRFTPDAIDICFYIVDGVMIVSKNDDIHNADFSCSVEV